jgi:hypothetical protein
MTSSSAILQAKTAAIAEATEEYRKILCATTPESPSRYGRVLLDTTKGGGGGNISNEVRQASLVVKRFSKSCINDEDFDAMADTSTSDSDDDSDISGAETDLHGGSLDIHNAIRLQQSIAELQDDAAMSASSSSVGPPLPGTGKTGGLTHEDREYPDDAADAAPGGNEGDAAPGGDEDDNNGAQTYALSDDRAEVLRLLGRSNGSTQCFACVYAKDPRRVAPVCKWAIDRITQFIQQCGSYNDIIVAQDAERMFETSVRAEYNKLRRPHHPEMQAWAAVDIYDHFFTQRHRRLDAQASLMQRILYMEQAGQKWRDYYVYTKIPVGQGKYIKIAHPDRMRSLRDLGKDLDRMYMLQPSKMPLAASASSGVSGSSALQYKPSVPFNTRPVYSDLPRI